jgi:hypothetical protein
MNGLGISLRDVIEAAIAFGIIAAQLRSVRASLRDQGRRIGKMGGRIGRLNRQLVALKAKKDLN